MHPDLEKLLYNRYPEIFADRDAPLTDSLMGFGFTHGDGWYFIIDNLCRCIQNHVEWRRRTDPEFHVRAVQVKEKFGTLRFYITGGDDEIRGMIRMAEAMSRNTCEITGDIGCNRMWATRAPGCEGTPTEAQMHRVVNYVQQLEGEREYDTEHTSRDSIVP
jgi:hypothetical protein